MTAAVVAGSTGLVVQSPPLSSQYPHLTHLQGSQMLSQLLAHPSISTVHAYTRRDLPNPTASSKLHPLTSPDTSAWPSLFPTSANPKVFLSGLATTFSAAGSLAAQRAIDVDLNYALALAAKASGVDTYVLISVGFAHARSWLGPYVRMKGELEDKIAALGFKHTVFVRPGVIVGRRAPDQVRVVEAAFQGVARAVGRLGGAWRDGWAQDDVVIARAAVRGAVECVEGRRAEGVWVMGAREIVRLGRVGKGESR
ncbi:hypothetical protein K491DRAFT_693458 [Lophiostoma macrostomum CBS 122681]|uniref:NAD(P)-binding domain-containing protein n=1 Tax=Lophiostoma macrostomum CBS 122681 TaxID=1314788 RepID=A0A6A6T458_9PLEO|nr:hypothetical protein K491DRAFT_693458 [Lophiostoma macrostomum CBS 122681]